MSRKKKKTQVRLPRALRRKVRPWVETRRKEILGAIKKAEGVTEFGAVDLASALLGVGRTTVFRDLRKYRPER